jgi:hypothetical protein
MGDSIRMEVLLERLAQVRGFTWQNIETWTLKHGLSSVYDAERVATLRLTHFPDPGVERTTVIRSLARLAGVRGQASRSWSLSTSIDHAGLLQAFITLAIGGAGFEEQALATVRHLEDRLADTARAARANPSAIANDLCWIQLYRVSRADTIQTRDAIARMRTLVRDQGSAPAWRVGTLDLCPQLLEAALENAAGLTGHTPALDRVEALLRRGPPAEVPGNIARIMVARWRATQGKYPSALAVLRGRDPTAWHAAAPATWREEGRIAALAGDTASAKTAYRWYLSIRDQPDPGPIADEARLVRDELARLGKRVR